MWESKKCAASGDTWQLNWRGVANTCRAAAHAAALDETLRIEKGDWHHLAGAYEKVARVPGLGHDNEKSDSLRTRLNQKHGKNIAKFTGLLNKNCEDAYWYLCNKREQTIEKRASSIKRIGCAAASGLKIANQADAKAEIARQVRDTGFTIIAIYLGGIGTGAAAGVAVASTGVHTGLKFLDPDQDKAEAIVTGALTLLTFGNCALVSQMKNAGAAQKGVMAVFGAIIDTAAYVGSESASRGSENLSGSETTAKFGLSLLGSVMGMKIENQAEKKKLVTDLTKPENINRMKAQIESTRIQIRTLTDSGHKFTSDSALAQFSSTTPADTSTIPQIEISRTNSVRSQQWVSSQALHR